MIPRGATIDGYHTYDDLRLVPLKKLTVNPAQPKYITFDIPGTDGELDVTEAIYGGIPYNDRTGTWSFLCVTGADYMTAYTNCLAVFNGERKTITLDDGSNTTYIGRFAIKEWQPGEGYSRVTVEYIIDDGTKITTGVQPPQSSDFPWGNEEGWDDDTSGG